MENTPAERAPAKVSQKDKGRFETQASLVDKGSVSDPDNVKLLVRGVFEANSKAMAKVAVSAAHTQSDHKNDRQFSDNDVDMSGSHAQLSHKQNMLPHEPVLLALYRKLTGFGGGFARSTLMRRLRQGKEDPLRLPERRGDATINRPEGALVWIHGASVGESLSVLPLVSSLVKQRPDLHFLVTTGTTTSSSLMVDRLPSRAFHQFVPVDYPGYVKKFFNHWKPDIAIFVESEFWPNLINEARERTKMMAIVNGRISPTSYAKWKKRPKAIRYLLSAFDVLIAQDSDNAERLRDLSSRDVMMFGNLKNAADPLPTDHDVERDLLSQINDRPVWLAASTHPNEEEMIFDAHRLLRGEFPSLLTIVAPRHPERGEEVATVAGERGLKIARRSLGDKITPDTDIYIADSLGELGVFYRISEIALVGGGLVPKGGHNPLEPARLECAILHGPHIFNFNETYGVMRQAGAAALVRNERDIAAAVKRLLSDGKTRQALAYLASQIAKDNATQTLREISLQLLEGIAIACPIEEKDDVPPGFTENKSR